ncbi:hypothetical protein QJS10_CPA01g00674 [Acorus calamus]|uniref:Uncharacterized protein n=1 Tax=Acorus calamus TaxID=4465 RepID=A0AAV9FFB3_ACOCL|nr:hypothetical protein QJS10_CPA01g00674 [Acorus calamus]
MGAGGDGNFTGLQRAWCLVGLGSEKVEAVLKLGDEVLRQLGSRRSLSSPYSWEWRWYGSYAVGDITFRRVKRRLKTKEMWMATA